MAKKVKYRNGRKVVCICSDSDGRGRVGLGAAAKQYGFRRRQAAAGEFTSVEFVGPGSRRRNETRGLYSIESWLIASKRDVGRSHLSGIRSTRAASLLEGVAPGAASLRSDAGRRSSAGGWRQFEQGYSS